MSAVTVSKNSWDTVPGASENMLSMIVVVLLKRSLDDTRKVVSEYSSETKRKNKLMKKYWVLGLISSTL
nr:hypothetical protein CFP56_50183 [Quercus suber]